MEWKADRRIPFHVGVSWILHYLMASLRAGAELGHRRVSSPGHEPMAPANFPYPMWSSSWWPRLWLPHPGLVPSARTDTRWLRLPWPSQCWPRTLRPEHVRSCPLPATALPPAVSAMSPSFPVRRPLCFLIRCGNEALKPHDKPVLTLSWHQLRENSAAESPIPAQHPVNVCNYGLFSIP